MHVQRMRNASATNAHVPVRAVQYAQVPEAQRMRTASAKYVHVCVPQAQRTRTANATYAYRKRNTVKFLFVSTVKLARTGVLSLYIPATSLPPDCVECEM